MTDKQYKTAATAFANRWAGRGYEKGDSQTFWIELLTQVLGVETPSSFIRFEQQARLDHTSFIDAMIPSTHVMIEQKSLGKDLRKPIRQSDGSMLTPFQQAKRYSNELPYSERPRWIVVCNFAEFDVYDMERPGGAPERVLLADLGKEYYRLLFLTGTENAHLQKEKEVSIQAGALVGRLYDALISQYDANDPRSLRWLNILCVRLVFCLYAEDAGVFGRRDMFHDYLAHYRAEDMRAALTELFHTLNTPEDQRSKYLSTALAAFPYTNGGLFAEKADIPQLTDDIRTTLLEQAAQGFDWSDISPTIFGGVFESTLNPETRRKGGMHYTSIENIHKVIDPLFLDSLRQELDTIMQEQVLKKRTRALKDFQDRMAALTFLDPACGSGNFLTETYISLRRMENEVIRAIYSVEPLDSFTNPIKVSIHQFYGIEVNDFAVTVATTALWISEAQMMRETENIISHDLDFLPLRSYANIREGNALRMDWADVCPQPNYIIGNPPFVGFTYMSASQKQDMQQIFPGIKNLDYVCCWYKKANDFIQGTNIECAFVSTNSIVQGETVERFFSNLNFKINFAYRSFVWNNEANQKAAVHCIIMAFATFSRPQKFIFDNGQVYEAKNINAYLCDAPDILIKSRNTPICDIPKMIYGNKPADGGYLIIEANEVEDFIKNEPQAKKFIRPFIGAVEFLHNKKRWCLWLVHATPKEIKECPLVYERVTKCREQRAASVAAAIRKFADTPTLFAQRTQPEGVDYLIIPRVSSENRRYVPIGFIKGDVIASDAVQIIPSATLYHFGVLTSGVHMAWMRAVCGRLEMRYRYSKDIVYNNFPWPDATPQQQEAISRAAQAILDARAEYPGSSLADLYDPATMPPPLLAAHRRNDSAVLAAYGFPDGQTDESRIVEQLLEMYARISH